MCPLGTLVKWNHFQWQATIPTNTSIEFQAAQADTLAGLPPAPPPGPPQTRVIATANTTVVSPSWAQGASTVHSLFGDTSKPFLRIYLTMNPDDQVSPTLHTWRQLYDCIPAE